LSVRFITKDVSFRKTKNIRRFSMKKSKGFQASLVLLMLLSFLLVGVNVASAEPNVQYLYSTTDARTVILVGTFPAVVGTYLGSVSIDLNITSQDGSLFWGEIAISIPTTPDPTAVAGFVTGKITNNGKMIMTIVDTAGAPVGNMRAVRDGKKLTKGEMQLLNGTVTEFQLKR
jgi:hypothetical protein